MNPRANIIVVLLLSFSLALFSKENDVNEARNTIRELREKDPKMDKFFSSSYGYAVFPGIGKGTVFKGGVAVADVKMTQVTVGFHEPASLQSRHLQLHSHRELQPMQLTRMVFL